MFDRRGQRTVGLALAAALLSGCFTDADGRQPDAKKLYYPTGMLVTPSGNTLYVANSDFDLQFSGGSVMAVDAAALRAAVLPIAEGLVGGASAADACASAGVGTNTDPWLNPGPCAPFNVVPFIRNTAFIGAFASGLMLTQDPDGNGARLFVPVRGDPSITYFDVQDDRDGASATYQLNCEAGADGFCGVKHRLGSDPERTLRGIQLPADPVGIAATADGRAIVSAHQTEGAASLVVNTWGEVPQLHYFLSGLPAGPTEVASIPEPTFVAPARAKVEAAGGSFAYLNGFALTFRSASELDVLRYYDDAGSVPPRPFISRTDAVPVTTGASGFDSRGIAILDTDRRACEQAMCADGNLNCLISCAENTPLRVFMANRSPTTLVLGTVETLTIDSNVDGEIMTTGAFESIQLYDSIPLDFGPSRVEIGKIVNALGQLEDRVFAVCFDSRRIFIFDPARDALEAVVQTGRGPHDITIDSGTDDAGDPYSLLYVGHFTDSYIGVIDLDQRRPLSYAQMLASVGQPTPPSEAR